MKREEARRIGREAKRLDPTNIRYRTEQVEGEWCALVWDKNSGLGYLEGEDDGYGARNVEVGSLPMPPLLARYPAK